MPLPVLAIGARLAVRLAKRLGRRAMTQRGLPAAAGGTAVIAAGSRILRKPSPFNPRGSGGQRGPAQIEKPWPVDKQGRPRRQKRNGQPWKSPSMNVGNASALRRSLRRLEGFRGLVKRVEAIMPGRQVTRRPRARS